MALTTRCNKCRKVIPMGNGYCEKCKPKRKDSIRKKKREDREKEKGVLSTSRWRKVRHAAMVRDQGCCRMCLLNGYIEYRNLEVHHLLKRVDREDLMYNLDNLVTLCSLHHHYLEDLPYEEQKRILKLD